MNETEMKEMMAAPASPANLAEAASGIPASGVLAPQACSTCGSAAASSAGPAPAPTYVFAVGRIAPRFPTPGLEKEFAQVVGRVDTKGQTDPQVMHKILSERHNRSWYGGCAG